MKKIKTSKKWFSLLAILIVSILVLTACGSSDDDGSSGETSGETQGATQAEGGSGSGDALQFMWFSDGSEGDVMQSIIEDFTAETGIEIELITVPYSDYESRISMMLQGGENPALARVTNPGYFADYALNLNDIINMDDYLETSQISIVDQEGNAIAIPVDVTANGVILNKPLADKYDIEDPELGDDVWTWDEFIAEMSKLQGQDDVVYPGVYDFSQNGELAKLSVEKEYLNDALLAAANIGISNIESAQPTLEDLFIRHYES